MFRKLLSFAKHLVPEGGTTERAVKSSFWLFGQNAFGRILQLATLVVLARLISPSELGLIGIALLARAGLSEFTSTGTKEVLVQNKAADIDDYLSTTFIIESVRGFIVGVLLFSAAPFVGRFFGEPAATPIVQAIALSPVLMGLKNPAIVYFQKDLEYHKQFLYQLSSSVVQFVVAVGYVLVIPSVWAYIVGYLAGDLTRVAMSYLLHHYRPSLQFDRAVLTEIVGYGKWITGSSILYFLYTQGDDVFVGWLLGPATLAFYQYAYRFSNAPATELSQVISDVMFAVYSRLQDDLERVRNAFFSSLRVMFFLVFPMAIGIAVVASSFVRTFLGSQWTPMIATMQILAAYGLMRAIRKSCSPIWNALGRPDFGTKISLVNVILTALFIYPATETYGIKGTAAVILGAQFLLTIISIYLVAGLINTSVTLILAEVTYPLAAATSMGVGTWWLHRTLTVSPAVEFVVIVVSGIIIYAVAALLIDWLLGWGISVDLETVFAGIRE
jgi:PST family polysaccharide transporter/lipopolysaccharide exporter